MICFFFVSFLEFDACFTLVTILLILSFVRQTSAKPINPPMDTREVMCPPHGKIAIQQTRESIVANVLRPLLQQAQARIIDVNNTMRSYVSIFYPKWVVYYLWFRTNHSGRKQNELNVFIFLLYLCIIWNIHFLYYDLILWLLFYFIS